MSLVETTVGAMSDDRSPEDRVAHLVGLLNVVTAELVGVIGEVLRAGAWEGVGIRSPEHWVVWRCGVSPGRARRLVRMARALAALPATNELFRVAELAPSLTVPQLWRVLPSVPRKEPDPDRTADDDEVGEPTGRCRRSVRFAHGDDGMWWCSVRLPADQGALVQKALEVGRDREFRLRHPDHDGADHPGDPSDVSWADGLLRFAHAGLDALDAGAAAVRPPGERTQVILHLDAAREVPPRLHLGPVLPKGIGDYLSCDASVHYLLVRHGQPVAMGRRERTVNPTPHDHRASRWWLSCAGLRPGALVAHPPPPPLDGWRPYRPGQPVRSVPGAPPYGSSGAVEHRGRPHDARRADLRGRPRPATRARPTNATPARGPRSLTSPAT